MTDNFEETWNSYLKEYKSVHPNLFFVDMQKELERRVK